MLVVKSLNIHGREINYRYAIWIALNVLIIIDIILISVAMFSKLPKYIELNIQHFDFIVCIILLAQWIITFYMSKPKKIFLKQKSNWIDLIASIPFDSILPIVIPQVSILRYLRLLKLIRVIALFNRFFNGLEKFIQKSNLDKIFGGVIFTIIIFTLLFNIYGSKHNLLDNFYFVIVTLTTVGYGDIHPITFNDKVITIALIFIGIFVFSTITAAISSFLTDRLLAEEDEEIEEKLDSIQRDMDELHKENNELKQEIIELKDLLKDK